MICTRLKEERERLGLTQPVFAELAEVSKRTVIDWEKGKTSPNAVQLSALAAAGADVQYILTGVRSAALPSPAAAPALNRREQALLDNYRHTPDEEGKKAIEQVALIAARANRDDQNQATGTEAKTVRNRQ
jgi:transcriptional regulator with XRE-family HTH domain